MVKIMHHSINYIKSICLLPVSVKKIATGLVYNSERDLLLKLELYRPINWKDNAII